jgi:peptidoglycan/LPS O-acetylase OafA/YrhL
VDKQDHFPVLDGLRGFAALSVVIFHLGHWLHMPRIAANGYYAVDFFFCLSGFVLARAYGMNKNPTLTAPRFFRIRLVRLVPLIVLGTLVSASYVAFHLAVTHQHAGYHQLPLAMLLGLVSLPYLHAPDLVGGPRVFPLNGPQFSLFLEFLVNFIWFYGRPLPQLIGSLAIAVPCLVFLMLFGTGGGDTTANFWHGFPRVGASYFLGVAIFEISRNMKTSSAQGAVFGWVFWGLCAAMAVLFYAPVTFSRPVAIVWVAAISPLLVVTGARLTATGRFRRLCLLGGRISYPVYILQYPMFCWVNGIAQTLLHRRVAVLEIPLCFSAILAFSYAAMLVYDEPVRDGLAALFRRGAGAGRVPPAC